MLVLGITRGNYIEITVPASPHETRVRVSLERSANARLGFIAPKQVTIMRSDAHVRMSPALQSQQRMQARRRTLLRDELD